MSYKAKLANIKLELDVKKDVPETFVSDPNRIRQIILNFISNAIKFTPAGSI